MLKSARSLPARERGSKLVWHKFIFVIDLSLPARERGSKPQEGPDRAAPVRVAPRAGAWIETAVAVRRTAKDISSLPARERGSKQDVHDLRKPLIRVAPRAGAWIETLRAFWGTLPPAVAPRAGAWIETHRGPAPRRPCWSLPARERGSKRATADIQRPHPQSLPARERGSKPQNGDHLCLGHESLPARERGSKLNRITNYIKEMRRSPRGSVDRNVWGLRGLRSRRSRSPRGSVDRNAYWGGYPYRLDVAPRAGAWIETASRSDMAPFAMSLPARERGSKRRHNVAYYVV